WPWVTRMASSALGCSIFGALGLSSQGSMAIVAPPGVVITHAACPHQVAVVPPAVGAGAGFAAAGAGFAAAGALAAPASAALSAPRAVAVRNKPPIMATIGNLS